MRKLLIIMSCLFFIFGMTHAWPKHPRAPKRKLPTTKTVVVTPKIKNNQFSKPKKPLPIHISPEKTAKLLAVKVTPPKATPVILDAPKKLAIPAVVKKPITEADDKTPATNLATVASTISQTTPTNPATHWMNVDMDWAAIYHWAKNHSDSPDQNTPGDDNAPPGSICRLVAEHPDWYRAAKVTEAKWGVPVNVQFAIMRTESKFNPQAKNPNSSAYGFAQALNGTWHRYQTEQDTNSNRANFSAASDFIGWYASHMQDELGINSNDAYRLYLAYHDGGAAYKRQQRSGQFKIGKLAHHVQRDADNFASQLSMCTLV